MARSEFKNKYKLLWEIEVRWDSVVYFAIERQTKKNVIVKYKNLDKDYPSRACKKISEDILLNELQFLLNPVLERCSCTPTLHDYFFDQYEFYIVTDYIKGYGLDTIKGCSEKTVVNIANKILKILRYLHYNNIIYRDVRPASFFEDEFHEIHIKDFSIAMLCDKNYLSDTAILGSPGFAPPEQYGSLSASPCFASDIYALGQTMKCLLVSEDIILHNDPQIPIRCYRKDVSPELEAVITKMTYPDLQERYQSVDEVLDALRNYKKINTFRKLSLLAKSSENIKHYNKIYNIEDQLN